MATVDELSLRCRKHDRTEAERDFGDGLILRCIARRRRAPRISEDRSP